MAGFEIKQEFFDKAHELTKQMTVKEKASLCSGKDFWKTKGIEHLKIPSIMMTDGPHGLRKQSVEADHLGISKSDLATCFPPACTSGSSYDKDLLNEVGQAIADESIAQEVSIVLGPGVNIKRSPLCGRNFEYFSEDPYLTSQMAENFINGVQSKGIGTSLKHYLANNQEHLRLVSDSVIDERALREIYLAAFETVVQNSKPWTIMCSYNKINGEFGSENKRFLTDILRTEWGFKGAVISDWGAVNNRVDGVRAGMDLEMPNSGFENDKSIVDAASDGSLDMAELNASVQRMTAIALAGAVQENVDKNIDVQKHDDLARRVARESAVLLKNDGILPLKKDVKVAVIGEFASKPRYQGAGSSRVNPFQVTSVCDEFTDKGIDFIYSVGYSSNSDTPDEALIADAVKVASEVDTALVFIGLPDAYESEGFDRVHLDLPPSHTKLLERVMEVNENTIAILYTGSAVRLPWADKAKGILLMYLTGQNNGGPVYDLVFGDYSPSGKLAETFPVALEDVPSTKWFATGKIVQYRESIYVGYRYFDKAKVQPAYPFGYGLSYAEFAYSDLSLSKKEMTDKEGITLKFKVKNIGNMQAKEVVQIYTSFDSEHVFRPVRELKQFAKIELNPQEEKEVSIDLNPRAFAYYNTEISDWHIESGVYTIEVGASSADIRLSDTVKINSDASIAVPKLKDVLPSYYKLKDGDFSVPDEEFEKLLGRPIPTPPPVRPFHMNSTVADMQASRLGRVIVSIAKKIALKMMGKDSEDNEDSMKLMIEGMMNEITFRTMGTMTGGKFTLTQAGGLVTMLNGKYCKGFIRAIRKPKR